MTTMLWRRMTTTQGEVYDDDEGYDDYDDGGDEGPAD